MLVSEETWIRYVEIRDKKHMKDSDVAKTAGIPQSTFSDWKKGKSMPKVDKMMRIAEALGVDYPELAGVYGKYSLLNPNRTVRLTVAAKDQDILQELIDLYRNATSDAQTSVMTLLRNSQKEPLESSKEA